MKLDHIHKSDSNTYYDFEVETRNISHFDDVRHPVHQQGGILRGKLLTQRNNETPDEGINVRNSLAKKRNRRYV